MDLTRNTTCQFNCSWPLQTKKTISLCNKLLLQIWEEIRKLRIVFCGTVKDHHASPLPVWFESTAQSPEEPEEWVTSWEKLITARGWCTAWRNSWWRQWQGLSKQTLTSAMRLAVSCYNSVNFAIDLPIQTHTHTQTLCLFENTHTRA